MCGTWVLDLELPDTPMCETFLADANSDIRLGSVTGTHMEETLLFSHTLKYKFFLSVSTSVFKNAAFKEPGWTI